METLWTLHVENFGRIERADIGVSPLTLFVGDNNSGKSYLLSLLYGLMRADDVLSDLCENSPEYQACAEWAEKILNEEEVAPWDNNVKTTCENLINRILQSNQQAILRSIFNENISAGMISLSLAEDMPRSMVTVAIEANAPAEKQIRDVIWSMLRSILTLESVIFGQIFFLPTARTGLLLTYPALTKDAFSRAYNRTENKNPDLTLTRPCTDFLGNLTTVKKSNAVYSQHKPIIRFIENGILHGKILVSNDLPLPVFSYRPETTKTDIPMFLTSDVIKEMTPLILALQYQNAEALFIEEPEMNLHPQLQQMMARVMVKLVNAGTPVFAATHSDTILQHVNNMIKLNNLPKKRQATLKKRFGFDKDDLISADKISMYQFDVQDNGRTIVQKLSCGKYGFEIPTFYAPLEALLQQTQDTEPEAEEYED